MKVCTGIMSVFLTFETLDLNVVSSSSSGQLGYLANELRAQGLTTSRERGGTVVTFQNGMRLEFTRAGEKVGF